jgi:hypothetical protein
MTIDSLKAFGANVEEGLERCMGMEDFYLEMIELGMSDERFEALGRNLDDNDLDEAFEKYIGAHGERRAFADPLKYADYIPLKEGVSAIRAAGGIPVLAHLFKYRFNERENMRLIQMFTEAGGKDAAMEVSYGRFSKGKQYRLRQIADNWRLLWSSGSDFHARDNKETLLPPSHTTITPRTFGAVTESSISAFFPYSVCSDVSSVTITFASPTPPMRDSISVSRFSSPRSYSARSDTPLPASSGFCALFPKRPESAIRSIIAAPAASSIFIALSLFLC